MQVGSAAATALAGVPQAVTKMQTPRHEPIRNLSNTAARKHMNQLPPIQTLAKTPRLELGFKKTTSVYNQNSRDAAQNCLNIPGYCALTL